jgi:trimeric autotransporter adhesin
MKNLITFILAIIFSVGLMNSTAFAADFSASCSASSDFADYGETVTWTAEASGGNVQSYDWEGTDDLSGTTESVDHSYSTDGDKEAKVIVTSDVGDIAIAECVMTVLAPLTFNSCEADEVNGMVGQNIAWTANISGGLAPYSFEWSGTDNLSGSDLQINTTYTSTGEKTAQIGNIFDSLTHTITGVHSCSAPVTIHPEPTGMQVSCSAGNSTLSTGGSVTWTANISGGDAPYAINWSGTDGLSATGNSVNKTYSTTGTKTASINVTSADAQTAVNISCGSVSVSNPSSGNDGGSNNNGSNNNNNSTSTNTTTSTSTSNTTGSTNDNSDNNSGVTDEEFTQLVNNLIALDLIDGFVLPEIAGATTDATTTASTTQSAVSTTTDSNGLFSAAIGTLGNNFNWILLLVILIIAGVLYFFVIRKKKDETTKTN